MPSQQSFGCHDGCDLSEHSSSQVLRPRCETATLVMLQVESSSAPLFSKNSILLAKIVDRLLLHPATEISTNRSGSKARSIPQSYHRR